MFYFDPEWALLRNANERFYVRPAFCVDFEPFLFFHTFHSALYHTFKITVTFTVHSFSNRICWRRCGSKSPIWRISSSCSGSHENKYRNICHFLKWSLSYSCDDDAWKLVRRAKFEMSKSDSISVKLSRFSSSVNSLALSPRKSRVKNQNLRF